MIIKNDLAIAALVGFLVGVFAIPTAFNLGLRSTTLLAILPLAVPPLWVFGVWLGGFLSRWLSIMSQVGKFVAVGFLNTAIDFGILNLLSAATSITSGFVIGGVNVPGFGVAVFNSYFWNKFWVFKDREDSVFHDFPKFLAVTLIGLLLNSAIVIFVTTFIPPFAGIGPATWLNLAKVCATAVVMTWNFVGYKFLVFRALTADQQVAKETKMT